MTLIVGLWTKGGVIIAADSASTFSAHNQTTITHSTQKLHVIAGCMVFGLSGPVGLKQKYVEALEEGANAKEFAASSASKVLLKMQDRMKPYQLAALQNANQATQALNDRTFLQNAFASSLVAFTIGKNHYLAEFQPDLNSELKTRQAPFVAIGSGQVTADPFTKFALKVLAGDDELTLDVATSAAIWVLSHAIECSPGGLGLPIQVMRLEQESGGYVVTSLTSDKVDEHLSRVVDIEKRIKDMFSELRDTTLFAPDAESIPSRPE